MISLSMKELIPSVSKIFAIRSLSACSAAERAWRMSVWSSVTVSHESLPAVDAPSPAFSGGFVEQPQNRSTAARHEFKKRPEALFPRSNERGFRQRDLPIPSSLTLKRQPKNVRQLRHSTARARTFAMPTIWMDMLLAAVISSPIKSCNDRFRETLTDPLQEARLSGVLPARFQCEQVGNELL